MFVQLLGLIFKMNIHYNYLSFLLRFFCQYSVFTEAGFFFRYALKCKVKHYFVSKKLQSLLNEFQSNVISHFTKQKIQNKLLLINEPV